jgi:hypothetical protein
LEPRSCSWSIQRLRLVVGHVPHAGRGAAALP